MALAPWMLGLLGADQSLAPNLGLLSTATGADPIKAAMAQLAANPPTPQMAPQAPQAPRAAPSRLPQAPGVRPAAPQQGQPPKDFGISPARAGIVAGSAALAQTPAIYGTGAAIGRALEAGLPAYIATKQQQNAARTAAAKEQEYRDMLNDPEVRSYFAKNPTALKLYQSMGAAQGLPALQKYIEERGKPQKLGKDEVLVGEGGEVIARGTRSRQIEKGPNGELLEVPETGDLVKLTGEKIEPLSPEAETLSQMTFGAPIKDLTPEQGKKLNELWKQLKHAGSSSTVINPAERAAEVGTVDAVLKSLQESKGKADAAQATHLAAEEMIQLLPKTIRGTGADFRLGVSNLLQTLGITPEDAAALGKVSSTQAFLGTAIRVATPLVRQISSRPTQVEFLKAMDAVGANLKDQPKAAKLLLEALNAMSQRTVKEHEELVSRIQKSPRWADVKDDLDLLRVSGANSSETPQHAHWRQLAEQFKNDPAALARLGPEPK